MLNPSSAAGGWADDVFGEAFLSFIGLGIQPPHTSLGAVISEGAQGLRFYPHLLWLPSAVFFLLMVCFNLLGDGLRDALDPRMRS
jgi:oligopeptide transport system permease protein